MVETGDSSFPNYSARKREKAACLADEQIIHTAVFVRSGAARGSSVRTTSRSLWSAFVDWGRSCLLAEPRRSRPPGLGGARLMHTARFAYPYYHEPVG